MKIRLKHDLPMGKEHGMTKDRVLDVTKRQHEAPLSRGSTRGRTAGYWVQGDADMEVLVHPYECEIVEDE